MNKAVVRGWTSMRKEIEVGGHRLVSDISVEEGGENAGPSPHDLLTSALGACTALTLHLYTRRKQWPLEGAEVTVELQSDGGKTTFIRRIALSGKLDDAQRARLLQVAEACPIHKTLKGAIEIRTELA